MDSAISSGFTVCPPTDIVVSVAIDCVTETLSIPSTFIVPEFVVIVTSALDCRLEIVIGIVSVLDVPSMMMLSKPIETDSDVNIVFWLSSVVDVPVIVSVKFPVLITPYPATAYPSK